MKQPQESSKWAQAPAFVDFVWFVFLGTRSLVDLVAGPRCVQWCRNYGSLTSHVALSFCFMDQVWQPVGKAPKQTAKQERKSINIWSSILTIVVHCVVGPVLDERTLLMVWIYQIIVRKGSSVIRCEPVTVWYLHQPLQLSEVIVYIYNI